MLLWCVIKLKDFVVFIIIASNLQHMTRWEDDVLLRIDDDGGGMQFIYLFTKFFTYLIY